MAEWLGMTHTELIQGVVVGLLVANVSILWEIRQTLQNLRNNLIHMK
jgi:hypothetical protein